MQCKSCAALDNKRSTVVGNESSRDVVVLAWLVPWYKLHLSAAFRVLFLPGWCQLTSGKSSLTCSTTLSQYELRYIQRMNWWPHSVQTQGYDFPVGAMHFFYPACLLCKLQGQCAFNLRKEETQRNLVFILLLVFIKCILWMSRLVFLTLEVPLLEK